MAEMATVRSLAPLARLSFRGGDAAAEAVGAAFGVPLPRQACRAAETGDRAALWLGPDEWLLIAPATDQVDLLPALAGALGGEPASLVDISDRQVAVEVAGAGATDMINAFNALDLGLAAFPAGMCTRTIFAKAEIVLWRRGAELFHIEVWRSFAPYVLGCLDEALRERAHG